MNRMKNKLKKSFIALTIPLLLMIIFYSGNAAIAAPNRVIKIVDAETGASNISLGSNTTPMPPEGYTFTVNVILDGVTEGLFTYQIGISFDKDKFKCVDAWIPEKDSNFVFFGKKIIKGEPNIAQANLDGCVFLGASLINRGNVVYISQGIFCQITFTAIKTGTSTLNVIPTTEYAESPYYGRDTVLMNLFDDGISLMLFTPQDLSVSVSASPTPPVASFTFNPANPKAKQAISFDASASYDPDGEVASYAWDFGDDTQKITANPVVNHIYDANGIYHIELEAVDNDDLSSSTTYDILIGELPYISFTYSPKEPWPYRGDTVTFDASESFDADGYITNYVWDFADGTQESTTDATITHVFSKNGIYSVELKIFDNDNLYNSATQDVFVGIRPVVDFTFSPENPNPDEEIVFNAYGSETNQLTYDPDGKIAYAIWDFGDLTIVEEEISNPTELVIAHTYAVQGGIYSVTLTVFDDEGLYTSAVQDVSVTIIHKTKTAAVPWEGYAAVGMVFGAITAIAVKYKRKPNEESEIGDYKVF